jgi:thioredoxin reductase
MEPALRHLPASPAGWELDTDVVVVGSGAAGLSAALAAAGHGRRVALVCKGSTSATTRHSLLRWQDGQVCVSAGQQARIGTAL